MGLFSNIFGAKGDDVVVGVDIGSSGIKVAQVSKEKGRVVLETYGEIALGPYDNKPVGDIAHLDAQTLATAVRDIFKAANVTTNHALMSIQASASLLFLIELPDMDDKTLASVIPNEARKYIPVPLSEVSLDWWILPEKERTAPQDASEQPKENKKEVLVVAIRNETFEQYKTIVKEAKLHTNMFEIEVFSNIRGTFAHEMVPLMLVDFGASATRVAVTEHAVVKQFHTINKGSQSITKSISQTLEMSFADAEALKKRVGMVGSVAAPLQDNTHLGASNIPENEDEAARTARVGIDHIFSELNSVLFNYEKKYNRVITKIILTGGGARLPGLYEYAKEKFNVEVLFGDPFAKVGSPKFLEGVLQRSGPEFSVAVGLALKGIAQ